MMRVRTPSDLPSSLTLEWVTEDRRIKKVMTNTWCLWHVLQQYNTQILCSALIVNYRSLQSLTLGTSQSPHHLAISRYLLYLRFGFLSGLILKLQVNMTAGATSMLITELPIVWEEKNTPFFWEELKFLCMDGCNLPIFCILITPILSFRIVI